MFANSGTDKRLMTTSYIGEPTTHETETLTKCSVEEAFIFLEQGKLITQQLCGTNNSNSLFQHSIVPYLNINDSEYYYNFSLIQNIENYYLTLKATIITFSGCVI